MGAERNTGLPVLGNTSAPPALVSALDRCSVRKSMTAMLQAIGECLCRLQNRCWTDTKDAMGNAVILFGAGASFGSDIVGVPPTGPELFEVLRRFAPACWGALPATLAHVFERDFEEGILRVAETRPHDMPVLQRAMAAFFLRIHSSRRELVRRTGPADQGQRMVGSTRQS